MMPLLLLMSTRHYLSSYVALRYKAIMHLILTQMIYKFLKFLKGTKKFSLSQPSLGTFHSTL